MAEQAQEWTCSMHPQIRSPQPGKCPLCGMDLIPVPQGDGVASSPHSLPMSENAIALADVRTLPVQRRPLALELRLVGKIVYDETRLADLTAWMPGRLERLFVDSTGVSVRVGEHLAEIYSPKLYAAQEELLQARRSTERLAQSPIADLRSTSAATFEAARAKLRLLGISEEQMDGFLAADAPQERITLRSPATGVVIEKLAQEGAWVNEGSVLYRIADLSVLWLELDAYESDLAWLRAGQEVAFQVAAYPGDAFTGRISLIHPMLRLPSRTVRVRVSVANPDLRLKPGMFVSARISARMGADARLTGTELSGTWSCPMHPEVLREGTGECPVCAMPLEPAAESATQASDLPLAIPATAPLLTGERAVVYLRVGDEANPVFEARRVRLGARAGAWYPVLEGLEEGELVVVHGAFRLDSELQLRGGESMMHAAVPEAAAAEPAAVSEEFRSALGEVLLHLAQSTDAFAAEELDAARAALILAEAAVATVPMSALEEMHRVHAESSLRRLADAMAATRTATSLATARKELQMVQSEAIELVRAFGYAFADERFLVQFHCPMAFDGAGGDWIQFSGTDTANPYFGEAMLRCGDEVRTLPKGDLK